MAMSRDIKILLISGGVLSEKVWFWGFVLLVCRLTALGRKNGVYALIGGGWFVFLWLWWLGFCGLFLTRDSECPNVQDA